MNPIVIMGMVVVAVFFTALMLTLSDEQILYSHTVEETSEIQSQRLHEEMHAVMDRGQILVENTGSVRITVKEIRVIDDDGFVVHSQKEDFEIHVAQDNLELALDTNTIQVLADLEDAE